jgi:hypothetical protein
VSWLAERGHRKREAKAAARLVLVEMEENWVGRSQCLDTMLWNGMKTLMSYASWETHRGILAGSLKDSEWEDLAAYYSIIVSFAQKAREADAQSVIDEPTMKRLIRFDATTAMEAMRDYLQLKATDGL